MDNLERYKRIKVAEVQEGMILYLPGVAEVDSFFEVPREVLEVYVRDDNLEVYFYSGSRTGYDIELSDCDEILLVEDHGPIYKSKCALRKVREANFNKVCEYIESSIKSMGDFVRLHRRENSKTIDILYRAVDSKSRIIYIVYTKSNCECVLEVSSSDFSIPIPLGFDEFSPEIRRVIVYALQIALDVAKNYSNYHLTMRS